MQFDYILWLLFWGSTFANIHFENWKNYSLIKEKKQNQVKKAHCKANYNLTLFHQEIKTKFSQKCKW